MDAVAADERSTDHVLRRPHRSRHGRSVSEIDAGAFFHRHADRLRALVIDARSPGTLSMRSAAVLNVGTPAVRGGISMLTALLAVLSAGCRLVDGYRKDLCSRIFQRQLFDPGVPCRVWIKNRSSDSLCPRAARIRPSGLSRVHRRGSRDVALVEEPSVRRACCVESRNGFYMSVTARRIATPYLGPSHVTK